MPHFVELQPQHLDELTGFCNRNFDFHSGQFEAEILHRRIFDDSDHIPDHGFLLRDNGKTIGFMVGVLRGNEAGLKLFAVDREHRRSGLGSMMLAEIEALFRSGWCRAGTNPELLAVLFHARLRPTLYRSILLSPIARLHRRTLCP